MRCLLTSVNDSKYHFELLLDVLFAIIHLFLLERQSWNGSLLDDMRLVLSTLVRCSTNWTIPRGATSLGCQDSNLHLRLKGQEKLLLVENALFASICIWFKISVWIAVRCYALGAVHRDTLLYHWAIRIAP